MLRSESRVLAYLSFISIALPDGLLGVAWPSMRHTLHQPVAAVGLLPPIAVVSSILASAATGYLVGRTGIGRLLAVSTALAAIALAAQAVAPAFWVVLAAAAVLAVGSGAIDAGLNAHAARHFNARRITWMHGCYGLGAAAGPLVVAGTADLGLSWRWAFGAVAVVLALLAVGFAGAARSWTAPPAPARSWTAQPAPAPSWTAAPAPAPSWTAAPAPAPSTVAGRASWSGAPVFALQNGLESCATLWAYTYLTGARGVAPAVGAAAVSGYWIALVVGRLVLGPVADRVGARRVLVAGLAGMAGGAALAMLPGAAAIAGVVLLGFAAAPMFPLLTLTTADRVGAARADRSIGLQVAAAAAGSALLPAAAGWLIAHSGPAALAPCLLTLTAATAIAYAAVEVAR
ncbi:MFS transporter [Actinomycetes bacterium KLBMP 9797]